MGCGTRLEAVVAYALVAAAALAFAPRLIAVWRFRQPLGSALLHPAGVESLLLIQWMAVARQWFGRPSEWKGRAYPPARRTRPKEA